jgi:hypothetical protein
LPTIAVASKKYLFKVTELSEIVSEIEFSTIAVASRRLNGQGN